MSSSSTGSPRAAGTLLGLGFKWEEAQRRGEEGRVEVWVATEGRRGGEAGKLLLPLQNWLSLVLIGKEMSRQGDFFSCLSDCFRVFSFYRFPTLLPRVGVAFAPWARHC